jgi:hypothetical protein
MSWYDLVAAFVFRPALRDAAKGRGGSGKMRKRRIGSLSCGVEEYHASGHG